MEHLRSLDRMAMAVPRRRQAWGILKAWLSMARETCSSRRSRMFVGLTLVAALSRPSRDPVLVSLAAAVTVDLPLVQVLPVPEESPSMHWGASLLRMPETTESVVLRALGLRCQLLVHFRCCQPANPSIPRVD